MGRNHRNGIIWSACAAAASNERARGRCEIAFISNISCAALFIEKWASPPPSSFSHERRAALPQWMDELALFSSPECGKRQLPAINAIIEDCARALHSVSNSYHTATVQPATRSLIRLGFFGIRERGAYTLLAAYFPYSPLSPWRGSCPIIHSLALATNFTIVTTRRTHSGCSRYKKSPGE